jgi:hypothetical protein
VEKILQIASATGWSAVFVYRSEDSGEVELETFPVAVWALVEKGPDTYITGYLGVDYCASPCSADPHFVGFLAEGQDAEERFFEEARGQLQELERASA